MGKRELVALLSLSSWCLMLVERLFLGVSWGCLRFVIVVFPDHTHTIFFIMHCLCYATKICNNHKNLSFGLYSKGGLASVPTHGFSLNFA